jgi:hypothetical protein
MLLETSCNARRDLLGSLALRDSKGHIAPLPEVRIY